MSDSSVEAAFARGVAALEAGNFRAAEEWFGSIIAANPRAHPAWNALAVAAVRAGSPEVAVERARRAHELDRRNPLYLNTLGVACGELGEFAESEAALRKALKLRPAYAEGVFNLGKALYKQGRAAESLAAYERAYRMEPEFPGLRRNLAQLYQLHAQPARALAVMEEAPRGIDEELAPTYAECLAERDGLPAAVAWLRAQVGRHPQMAKAKYALGAALLLGGEWRDAWPNYDWRLERAQAPLPRELAGRRVLLLEDQGLGDVLFFLRWVGELRARGAAVALQCPAPLLPLVGDLAAENADPGAFDFSLPIGCLPSALGSTSVPSPWPLAVDAAARARIGARLAALGPPPYVGVAWRAGTDTLRRREFGNAMNVLSKEIAPALLGAALRGVRGTLISVQRLPRPGETQALAAAAQAAVHDFSATNADLVDMLALLERLDDQVTVSNTNVHLRAGLGKGGRVLVPYPADWRWMHEGNSPWFPAFPVYRQPQDRNWEKPLQLLRKDLLP